MPTGPDLLYSNFCTGTRTPANTSSVSLAPQNDNRNGLWIFNDSPSVLYVKVGSGSANSQNYSFQLPALGFFQCQLPCPRDPVSGFWTAVSGSALITQID